jgi:hypothetical protein
MTIQQRYCSNHPQRPAIGVCVITHKPICGECSTRYEGVNYSKEGLQILQQQRAAAARKGRGTLTVMITLAWCLVPLLLWLVYLSYMGVAELLLNALHPDS